jgi:hypothetical protein
MEIRAVLGMHDLECARHAFNGRHLSVFELRQGSEARAPTLHAVKPFGPSIDHWTQSPSPASSYGGKPRPRCSKLNTLQIQTQNATKLETNAWRRLAETGNCNAPVSMGLTKVGKGSKVARPECRVYGHSRKLT